MIPFLFQIYHRLDTCNGGKNVTCLNSKLLLSPLFPLLVFLPRNAYSDPDNQLVYAIQKCSRLLLSSNRGVKGNVPEQRRGGTFLGGIYRSGTFRGGIFQGEYT